MALFDPSPRVSRGVAAGLLALAALGGACGGPSRPERAVQSVVVFTVDTLRADALEAFSVQGSGTPAITAFADEALLFERAYSQATSTHPALSSMLTGLFPHRNGVLEQRGSLHASVASLPELVEPADVATGAFVANLCELLEIEDTVFHDGWDETFCGITEDTDHWEWDVAVLDAALAWIEEQRGPYVCWIHLMDPHGEHRPPPDQWDYASDPPRARGKQSRFLSGFMARREMPSQPVFDRLWSMYRAEVRGIDAGFARLLAAVDAKEDGARTAIVFGSDHGEEMYDSWCYIGHGYSLNEGVLHVPLMVRAPGVEPGRVAEPVELLQVTPTVLELLEVPAPIDFDGASLLAQRPSRGASVSTIHGASYSIRDGGARSWIRLRELDWRGNEPPWAKDAPWLAEEEAVAAYPTTDSAPAWTDVADDRERLDVHRDLLTRLLESAVETAGIESDAFEQQLLDLGYVDRGE